MKVRSARKFAALIFAVLLCTALLLTVGVAVFAQQEEDDAMAEISLSLSSYRIGETVTLANDGYIGIPVELTTFYDRTKGTVTGGYTGTPIILYFVNTAVERIGTDSDVSIITSMLDRGYVVMTVDYKNSDKAVSPDLDWSAHALQNLILKGGYFTDTTVFAGGPYYENYVVPAGYDVLLKQVYWEIDKHGADGTLEKIVEIWNNDFRGHFGDTVIPWVHEDGERKAVQNAFDGTSPIWEDDTHIKIKYTKAETVTDCVKPDGTPVELNLYMDITYPTSPAKTVPVACHACSSQDLCKGTWKDDRPQHTGFLFNGYAAVNYEFCHTPMARDDAYGYFDGNQSSGHVSGDNNTYSLQFYNNIHIDSAAMRFVRTLAINDPETYAFNLNKIGVFGVSKGGWMTPLGEEDSSAFRTRRVFEGHHGETRYENGITESYTVDGFTIDGGEEQPWLYAKGEAVDCQMNFIYASVGGADEYISTGHVPTYITCHQRDDSYYGTSNKFVHATRAADVPALWLEVAQGHSFASENDIYHNVNTYQALFDFAGYYLKDDPVKVLYLDSEADFGGMPTDAGLVLKFTGPVSAEEIAKVTVTLDGGTVIAGEWSSAFGNTEWTFTHGTLPGDTNYTVTVPASVKGDNGFAMGEDYVKTFTTGHEKDYAVSFSQRADGIALWFTVPDVSSLSFTANRYTLRLNVVGESTNCVKLYRLTGFDGTNPESASVGSLVSTVAVGGKGCYDVDITSLIASAKVGDTVAFVAQEGKSQGSFTVNSAPLSSATDGVTTANCVSSIAQAPDSTYALKIESPTLNQRYFSESFYSSLLANVTNPNVCGTSPLTAADYGRRFTVTGKIYDTTSRVLVVRLANYTNSSLRTVDYIGTTLTLTTKAGEWVEFTLPYTVYEAPDGYSQTGLRQSMTVHYECTGDQDLPIYFKDFKTVETVTAVSYDAAAPATFLVSTTEQRIDPNSPITDYGVIPLQYADAETYPFVAFDDTGFFLGASKYFYGTQSDDSVITIAKNYLKKNVFNGTDYGSSPKRAFILMRRDYQLSSTEYYDNLAQIQGTLTIDLGGFTLSQSTGSKPIFPLASKGWPDSGDALMFPTEIAVKNGKLLTFSQPICVLSTKDSSTDGSLTEKVFTMDYTDVTFGFAEFSSTQNLLTRIANGTSPNGAKGPFVFLYNDCTFDLTGNPTSLLFNAATTAANYATVDVTVKGGTILAESVTGVALTSVSSGNSVTFTTGSEGKFPTLSLPAAENPVTEAVSTPSGTMLYQKSETVGDRKIWSLEQTDSLDTPYGKISAQYADISAYPFVVFDEMGNCIGAYANFYGENSGTSAVGRAKDYMAANVYANGSYGESPKAAFILMRRDYTFTSTERYDNLAQVQGTLTVDFGGFTLTANATSNKALISATAKGWGGSGTGDAAVFPTELRFKNGTMLATTQTIMTVCASDSTAGRDLTAKAFTLDFTYMTFGLAKGATVAIPLLSFWGGNSATGTKAPFTINFNDCTVDFATVVPAQTKCLFNGTPESNSMVTVTVNVKGGSILASAMSKFNLYRGNVNFTKGKNGYLSITLPSTASAPTLTVTTAEGATGFSKVSTRDGYTLYRLGGIRTAYGLLPEDFADTAKYPFAVFDENGKFIGAYSVFYGDSGSNAVSVAKDYVKGNVWKDGSYGTSPKSAVILMRRDFVIPASQTFNNLAQIQGEVILDLGGFTLSREVGNNKQFFNASAKGWPDSGDAKIFPTTFSVKNGTLAVAPGQYVLTCNMKDSYGDGSIRDKVFTLKYENVIFLHLAGDIPNSWLADFWAYGGDQPLADCPFVLTYKNCIYDTTACTSTGKLFFAHITNQCIDLTYTVEGATILANSVTAANLAVGNPSIKNDIKIVLPAEGDASGVYVKLDDGKTYVFEKGAEAWTPVLPKIDGFKQNVVFQTNFKTNLYIPKTSDKIVTGVTYEGTPLTLGERVIDDKVYYVATVEVGAEEANEKIALAITFTLNGNTYTQTVSTNIVAYAQALAKISAYENLANAMLYYAKCAAPTAEFEATRVEATKAAAVNTMAQGTPVTGASVAICSAPVFTFALDNTYSGVIRFTWKSGEQTVTVDKTVECDASVTLNELKLYDFTETIIVSYKNGDAFTEVGQYNLSAYAASDAGLQNADLVNALYDYAEQAKAYIFAK